MNQHKDNSKLTRENEYESLSNNREIAKKTTIGNFVTIFPLLLMILFSDDVTPESIILLIAFIIIGFLGFVDLLKKHDEYEFQILARSAVYTLAATFPVLGVFTLVNLKIDTLQTNSTELFAAIWMIFLFIYFILNRKNKASDYE